MIRPVTSRLKTLTHVCPVEKNLSISLHANIRLDSTQFSVINMYEHRVTKYRLASNQRCKNQNEHVQFDTSRRVWLVSVSSTDTQMGMKEECK